MRLAHSPESIPVPHSLVGCRVPDVSLGFLARGEVESVSTAELFRSGRSLVLGVPGAFAPVCTKQHVPDFVRNAEKLTELGFARKICIAPNDPFVLEAWARTLDPEGKLRFLSDGNLDFTNAMRLGSTHRDLFLGARSERYMLIVEDGILRRVTIERSILTYTCTRAADAVMV